MNYLAFIITLLSIAIMLYRSATLNANIGYGMIIGAVLTISALYCAIKPKKQNK